MFVCDGTERARISILPACAWFSLGGKLESASYYSWSMRPPHLLVYTALLRLYIPNTLPWQPHRWDVEAVGAYMHVKVAIAATLTRVHEPSADSRKVCLWSITCSIYKFYRLASTWRLCTPPKNPQTTHRLWFQHNYNTLRNTNHAANYKIVKILVHANYDALYVLKAYWYVD